MPPYMVNCYNPGMPASQWDFRYTSGKIWSRNKLSFGPTESTYIEISATMRVDKRTGVWPAFWLLPEIGDNSSLFGVWPSSGEIDIFEHTNVTDIAQGTLVLPLTGADGQVSPDFDLTRTTVSNVSSTHVYTLRWSSTRLDWLIDGVIYKTYDNIPAQFSQQQYYIIFDLALGGSYAGDIIDVTPGNPAKMQIDSITVTEFQNMS